MAERSGVVHESPQIICFVDGKVVGHASHRDVTAQTMKRLTAPQR